MRLNPQSKLIPVTEADSIVPTIGIWFGIRKMKVEIDTSSEAGTASYQDLTAVLSFYGLFARFSI